MNPFQRTMVQPLPLRLCPLPCNLITNKYAPDERQPHFKTALTRLFWWSQKWGSAVTCCKQTSKHCWGECATDITKTVKVKQKWSVKGGEVLRNMKGKVSNESDHIIIKRDGLSSGWSFIRVVFQFQQVVSHQIRVVFVFPFIIHWTVTWTTGPIKVLV